MAWRWAGRLRPSRIGPGALRDRVAECTEGFERSLLANFDRIKTTRPGIRFWRLAPHKPSCNSELLMDNWLMNNWYQIESNAEHRRLEWDRAVAAHDRAELACPKRSRSPRAPLSRSSVWSSQLRQLVKSGLAWITSITSCQTASSPCSTGQSHPAARTNGV
jgi:hypothetical protein